MSDHKKHINSWLNRLLDYRSDRMSNRDRNRFEKDLEKDAFEADAFEGFSSISDSELLEDLSALKKNLDKRTRKRNPGFWLRIAAGFALIALLSFSYYFLFEQGNKYFPENMKLGESTDSPAQETIIDSIADKDIPHEFTSETTESENPEPETRTENMEPPQNKRIIEDKQLTQPKTASRAIEESPQVKTEPARPGEEKENEMIVFAEADIESESAENLVMPTEPAGIGKLSAKKSRAEYINQTIRGNVFSSEDSLPIPGAVIQLRDSEIKAVTNTDGYFEITPTGEESELIADMSGLITKDISINKDGSVNIMMEPDEITRDEMLVVGYTSSPSIPGTSINDKEDSEQEEFKNDYSSAFPSEGFKHFREYIAENMIFPETDEETNRAVVILKTIIDPVGRPTNIRIVKSPDKAFSEEAIRLLREGPLWTPAKRDGEYLEEETRVRIVFRKAQNP